jgi:hypothetical protein
MIAALVPIGMYIKRFFPAKYMDALLIEEDPVEEEEMHGLD